MVGTGRAVGAGIGSFWTDGTGVERLGYAVGALLIVSGVIHAGVFLVDGGPWQGPVSWRKPTTFGLSFGLTTVTVTWLTTFLAVRPRTQAVVVVGFAAASALEVALVTMQRWRGVPSHFNADTAFDGAVFTTMGAAVTVIGVVLVVVTVLAFTRLEAPPSMALAVRTGLLVLLAAQGIGARMIVEGTAVMPDPIAYGVGGALKLPHAVTMHAVQVLPGLAFLLSFTAWPERRRVGVVAGAAAGHAGLAVVALAVAGTGARAAGPGVAAVGVASAGLLVAAGVACALALARAPALAHGLTRQSVAARSSPSRSAPGPS